MADIYVPNYMSFHNDNTFLGSYEGMRFKLTPELPDGDHPDRPEAIRAEYWYGPLCYDLSQMDGEERFPLTEEGIARLTQRLVELSAAGREPEA